MWRRFAIRDRIQQLDAKADCQQIIFLVGTCEFPWLVRKALEFALFRSFAIPSISQILDRTGQFREYGQRRYDDTVLIIAALAEHGYEHPRGRPFRLTQQKHRSYPDGYELEELGPV